MYNMTELDKVFKKAHGMITRIHQGIFDIEKLRLPVVAILMAPEDYKLFLTYLTNEYPLGHVMLSSHDTFRDIPILVVPGAKLKVLTSAYEEYMKLPDVEPLHMIRRMPDV